MIVGPSITLADYRLAITNNEAASLKTSLVDTTSPGKIVHAFGHPGRQWPIDRPT